MNEYQENRVEFIGTIAERIQQQPTDEIIQQENGLLHKIVLYVHRESGQADEINVFIDEKELRRHRIGSGQKVSIEGVMRTCNVYDCQRKLHVITYVRAWTIRRVHSETADKNNVIMEGTLSQTPRFWKSPRGRRHLNFNLRTEDLESGITSFIPCIARNAIADILCELGKSEELSFMGKLQSRKYMRTFGDGQKRPVTTFEVMVVKLI